jgi:hypothetical protein
MLIFLEIIKLLKLAFEMLKNKMITYKLPNHQEAFVNNLDEAIILFCLAVN